jgi:hypothetical protein
MLKRELYFQAADFLADTGFIRKLTDTIVARLWSRAPHPDASTPFPARASPEMELVRAHELA